LSLELGHCTSLSNWMILGFLAVISLSTDHEDYQNQDVNLSDLDWENSFPNILDGDQGGAFSATNLSLLTIIRCQFVNCGCSAQDMSGGVAYVRSVWPFNVTVINVTVNDCYANLAGGGFFFPTAPKICQFSNVTFSNATAYRSMGGALAFSYGCGRAQIDGCVFRMCNSTAFGGAICIDGSGTSTLSITNSVFDNNWAIEAGAIFATEFISQKLTSVTFLNGHTDDTAVYLSLQDSDDIFVTGCHFSYDKAGQMGRTAILLNGQIMNICFMGCCFNCTRVSPVDSMPAHIYGYFEGSITFELPMCFDATKNQSVAFYGGQDPAGDLDIFNCTVCPALPTPAMTAVPSQSPKVTPMASHSPDVTPFATAVPSRSPEVTPGSTALPSQSPEVTPVATAEAPTEDPDKLSTRDVILIAVGSSVIFILLIVAVVLGILLYKARARWDDGGPDSFLSSQPLLSK
jgi:hypothetical protein